MKVADRLNNDNKAVLAVFAHPDDDALTCFGTLARLQVEQCQVHVLTLTAGRRSATAIGVTRLKEAEAAARLAGYSLFKEDLSDGQLMYDVEMVSLVEKYIRSLSARIVITHYPQELGQGHQDHVTVASATINAARRSSCVDWILYAEPPIQNGNFSPNFFVDITEYLELKKKAIELHCSESAKSYMWPEAAETRARWWAIQAHPEIHKQYRSYESFVIIKGILRQSMTTSLDLL